ncbi:MAG: ribonuclease Z [Thermofilum sp. ex4484_15]|nr:MAG: ribonuclease Z [Thermofilum sp. ex4484_15]
MEVIFLGSGGVMPTRKRKTVSIAVRREGEILLFDCGEGCQNGFTWGGLGVNRELKVFISHLHGDHVLGLPGLLMSLDLLGRNKELTLIGPKGIMKFVNENLYMTYHEVGYGIKVLELEGERITVLEGRDYRVIAVKVKHTVPCYAYVLEEADRPGRFLPERAIKLGVPKGPLWKELQRGICVKLSNGRIIKPFQVTEGKRRGVKIIYSGDTRPYSKLMWAALGADLLIHEATFSSRHYLKAMENGHTTALEAGEIASFADAKKLILVHISPRYEGKEGELLSEAKLSFEGEVMVAEDWLRIKV